MNRFNFKNIKFSKRNLKYRYIISLNYSMYLENLPPLTAPLHKERA